MEIVEVTEKYQKPIVLCLGFFDCMHIGHLTLLNRAKEIARENNAQVALFTFRNNHFETLNRPTKLIYSFDERLHIYESLGVDAVVYAEFDKQFMERSGEDFLKLLRRFDLRGVVCGEDFTCGSNLLSAQKVKEKLSDSVAVDIVPLVLFEKEKVCSSLIRKLLSENKLEKANSFLSEPFFFFGKVIHGRHIGSKLGFPTANLDIPSEKLAPLGVYGGKVSVEGKTFSAIVNVGNTPTFGVDKQTVEAYILDFDGDLYDKYIKVSLTRFLRKITKFSATEELRAQLRKDAEVIRNDSVRS